MSKFDITLLTDSRYVTPVNPDWYVLNILNQDSLITSALERKGMRVFRTNWDNKNFDWRETRSIVFRSTWDYFHRFSEFAEWLHLVNKQTQLINPFSIIHWNMDKHYLKDLEQAGIAIPPTTFIEKGDTRTLREIVAHTNWNEFILKPAVSGAARHTYRFQTESTEELEEIFRKLIDNEAMLLQEFQQQILSKGEVALMLFNGKFSHAVLKKAKQGDFRVQDDFGGSVHDYSPTQEEISFAEKVVSVCESLPVYARVDVIWDNQDRLCVSELELIEPELWMRKFPSSAEFFADSIVAAITLIKS